VSLVFCGHEMRSASSGVFFLWWSWRCIDSNERASSESTQPSSANTRKPRLRIEEAPKPASLQSQIFGRQLRWLAPSTLRCTHLPREPGIRSLSLAGRCASRRLASLRSIHGWLHRPSSQRCRHGDGPRRSARQRHARRAPGRPVYRIRLI
jgi:hypothetical protein